MSNDSQDNQTSQAEQAPQKKSSRLRIILALLLTFLLLFFFVIPPLVTRALCKTIDPGPYEISAKARELHQSLVVIDLHADSLLWSRDLLQRGSHGHVDVPRMSEGNLAIQAFTVVTKVPNRKGFSGQVNGVDVACRLLAISQRWPLATWNSMKARALYQAQRLHNLQARSQGRFRILKTRQDIDLYLTDRSKDPRLTAGFLGIEGAHCLEGKFESLDEMFTAGFRMLGPCHFFDTELGGSAHGLSGEGLTDFGKKIIERMEEIGMTVDVAHASPKMIDDILKIAKKPVLASHTGVRGVHDIVRNLSDDHVKGIAKTGGVVGVGFWEHAVGGQDAASIARTIKYVRDLVGVDHVALGSDYDGSVTAPFHCGGLAKITEALQKEGFSNDEIKKVMGLNTLRVMRANFPNKAG